MESVDGDDPDTARADQPWSSGSVLPLVAWPCPSRPHSIIYCCPVSRRACKRSTQVGLLASACSQELPRSSCVRSHSVIDPAKHVGGRGVGWVSLEDSGSRARVFQLMSCTVPRLCLGSASPPPPLPSSFPSPPVPSPSCTLFCRGSCSFSFQKLPVAQSCKPHHHTPLLGLDSN